MLPKPPSSVPGPYQPPAQPPGLPVQRLPSVRYWTVTQGESLRGLAQRVYGNSARASDIFNANRVGKIRDDRSPGFLNSPNDNLIAGQILIIP